MGKACSYWSKYGHAKNYRPSSSKLAPQSWVNIDIHGYTVSMQHSNSFNIIPISRILKNSWHFSKLWLHIDVKLETPTAWAYSYQHHNIISTIMFDLLEVDLQKTISLHLLLDGHAWFKTISFSGVPGTSTVASEIILHPCLNQNCFISIYISPFIILHPLSLGLGRPVTAVPKVSRSSPWCRRQECVGTWGVVEDNMHNSQQKDVRKTLVGHSHS